MTNCRWFHQLPPSRNLKPRIYIWAFLRNVANCCHIGLHVCVLDDFFSIKCSELYVILLKNSEMNISHICITNFLPFICLEIYFLKEIYYKYNYHSQSPMRVMHEFSPWQLYIISLIWLLARTSVTLLDWFSLYFATFRTEISLSTEIRLTAIPNFGRSVFFSEYAYLLKHRGQEEDIVSPCK